MESYTFLYVPHSPLDILMTCKKFVHVPYTFLYIPCDSSTKSMKWDTALQLPKGLSSCAWIPTPFRMWPSRFRSYASRYTFLYVPVRCSRTKGLSSCAWFPTRVLMRPSCLRSYTFRYTFLYVPVRCRRTRLHVQGCPHTPLSLHP